MQFISEIAERDGVRLWWVTPSSLLTPPPFLTSLQLFTPTPAWSMKLKRWLFSSSSKHFIIYTNKLPLLALLFLFGWVRVQNGTITVKILLRRRFLFEFPILASHKISCIFKYVYYKYRTFVFVYSDNVRRRFDKWLACKKKILKTSRFISAYT